MDGFITWVIINYSNFLRIDIVFLATYLISIVNTVKTESNNFDFGPAQSAIRTICLLQRLEAFVMVNVQVWAFEAFHFVYRLELLQADGAFSFVQLLFQPVLLEVSLERLLVLTSLFVTKKLILSLIPHQPKLLETHLYQDAQRI